MLWNTGTLARRSRRYGDRRPRTYGLDAAVGAAFLALLWPRLVRFGGAGHGGAAAALALGLVPFTTPGVPVLAAGPGRGPDGLRGAPMTGLWAAVLVTAAGCYLLKLLGLSLPERVLDRPIVPRVADLVPVALLAALVAVQVFADGTGWSSTRAWPASRRRVVALLLRAPFLVVVVVAAADRRPGPPALDACSPIIRALRPGVVRG